MPANAITAKSRRLERLAERIARAEADLDELRAERNREIAGAVTSDPRLSERAAARAAGVAPSYAHRCVAGNGSPDGQ